MMTRNHPNVNKNNPNPNELILWRCDVL